jgi:chromosome segregation ATPase
MLPVLSEKTQPLPFEGPEPEVKPKGRRGPPDRFLFALFWTLAAMAAIALLSVLWFRELDRRKDADKRAAAAQGEVTRMEARFDDLQGDVAALEEDLAGARAELKPLRLRIDRRGEALRSTRGVLALVSPLRETYAELDDILTTLNADGDAIAAAAAALNREVDALADYVSQTPENQLSKRRLREHTTTLRARNAALRAARSEFAGAQTGYSDAAERVDSGLDDLAKAATALRKEIAKALRR